MMLINAGMLFLGMLLVKSKKIDMLSTLCGTEAGDQRGGWMWADQNFFRNSNRRPISRKSPKPSSVLAKVWNSYGKAKPTQKASNERAKPRSKSEANQENCRTDLPGLIWPVPWTGLTGLAYRSDRWHPENPRKLGFKRWISTKRPRKSMKLGGLLRPTPWTYPQKISS